MLLGVGTGELLNEVPATGMEWPPFKERFHRLREAIELMRRLAREERVTYEGDYYRTAKATVYDRPEVPVPIYVAASGAVAARLAGQGGRRLHLHQRQGAGAVSRGAAAGGRRGPGEVGPRWRRLRAHDRDEGLVRHGSGRAMEDTRHWAALALSGEEKMAVEDPLEMERLADALPAERAASRWIVSTDPDEHVERLAETIALGFTHLVFHAPGPDQRRFLDLYAQQVLPRLRARYG